MRDSDRLPVLMSGGTYCSPRCGFGCTKAAHDRADAEGRALAEKLGAKWSHHVWENGGWHYKVKCGVIDLHVSTRGSKIRSDWTVEGYSAYIQTRPQFISGTHTDPKEAIREALNKMQAVYDDLTVSIGDMSELFAPAMAISESNP